MGSIMGMMKKIEKLPLVSELGRADVDGKVVLVRVDYNVPLEMGRNGWRVKDERRINASVETIKYLQKLGAKVVLISHLGRPGGRARAELSLAPALESLKKLGIHAVFCAEPPGAAARETINQLNPGQVLLLENLRFYPGEKANDAQFAKTLASLGDIYVNEAFSNCHRQHASIVGVPQHLPGFAGFALDEELRRLDQLMQKPERPFVAVIGGSKIVDKVGAIRQLANLADVVLVGGGVANDFLLAEGVEVYRSKVEDKTAGGERNLVDLAAELIEEHKYERVLKDGYLPLPKIIYPVDVLAAPSIETDQKKLVQTIDLTSNMKDMPEKTRLVYLDIGPKTSRLYRELISQAGTVFWNGPMGVWENKLFRDGTHKIADAIAGVNATTIIGGGDTLAAIDAFGLEKTFTYVSTGGGAALEFLSGHQLPGIAALTK